MHENSDADDEGEVVDDVGLHDLHLGEELGRRAVVAVVDLPVLLLAEELASVVPVHRHQETVEARPEVGYVEEPPEAHRGVHVPDAEAEDREQDGYDGTGEHCDLKIKYVNNYLNSLEY